MLIVWKCSTNRATLGYTFLCYWVSI